MSTSYMSPLKLTTHTLDVSPHRRFLGKSGAQLRMVVNRYARDAYPNGKITIVFAHATGMHKELWDPVIREIDTLTPDAYELWAIDCSNAGDSAVLNDKILPEACTLP
jgi:hypothetical protein